MSTVSFVVLLDSITLYLRYAFFWVILRMVGSLELIDTSHLWVHFILFSHVLFIVFFFFAVPCHLVFV